MIEKTTTKDLLAASLRELMQERSFEKITVRDIVQNCGVSSTTFYKHFQDKYALAEWIYQKESRIFIDKISDAYTWKDAALETLYSFRNNIEYYRSYFRSDNHADDLNMITYANAVDTIRKLHGEESIDDELRFILLLYLRGVTRMTIEWLMDTRENISPEVFVDRLMTAMPERIRELLF